jgi:hypothetical protein
MSDQSRRQVLKTGVAAAALAGIARTANAESAARAGNGSTLPFPSPPSANLAGPTLQESKHQRRVDPNPPAQGRPHAVAFLGHGVLLIFDAPSQLLVLEGLEHGRTIPTA